MSKPHRQGNKQKLTSLPSMASRSIDGFAWVEIPNGRSPFVNWARKNDVGTKHYQKGWQVWNPTKTFSQSMDVREAGATAFAKVLRDNGIEAYMVSRAD